MQEKISEIDAKSKGYVDDTNKPRSELILELNQLRRMVGQLELLKSGRRRASSDQLGGNGSFRQVIELLPLPIFIIDSNGNYEYLNSKFIETFGYTLEDIPHGRVWFELAYPDEKYREAAISAWVSDLKGSEEYQVRPRTFTVACKDGKFREILFMPVTLEDQKQFVIAEDMTERKESEKALCESEEKLAGIVDSVTDHMSMVDEQFNIVWINGVVERQFDNNIVGQKCYSIYRGRSTVCETCIISQTFVDGEVHEHETKIVDNDGIEKDFWCTSSVAVKHSDGKPKFVVEVARDITDREKAEVELLRRNRDLTFLNAIAQTVSQSHNLDEILNNVLDKTLQLLQIENGSFHLLDKDTGNLVMGFYRGIDFEVANTVPLIKMEQYSLGRRLQQGEPMYIESLLDKLHEAPEKIREIVCEHQLNAVMLVPLKVRGEILGVMSLALKKGRTFMPEERELLITVSHQLGAAIENAQLFEEASRIKALEELDRLRTELLASVSHELRTPLTAIKGLAETLVQPDIEWDKETEYDFLHTINRESDVLTRIVEDLMQMSQIEAGVMQIVKRRSSIDEVVSQLESKLAKITEDHQYEENIPDGLWDINVDEMRIGQVITNLVSNAVSYSKKGTKITLSAEALDSQIVVSVRDEGIGIPSKHISKVFDRFYRLESGVARRRGGTGLGLSICKGIVERHDGMIWVESKARRGSKFSFSLPVMKEPQKFMPD